MLFPSLSGEGREKRGPGRMREREGEIDIHVSILVFSIILNHLTCIHNNGSNIQHSSSYVQCKLLDIKNTCMYMYMYVHVHVYT